MAKKRRSRKHTDQLDEPMPQRRKPRRKRRFFRRFALLLALLVGVTAALPTIISRSPLRDTVLGLSMPVDGWAITSRSADLSWTGTQHIEGIRITDPAGEEVLTAERVSLDRSIFALITNYLDLGKLTLQQPSLALVTRPDGSNVEDFIDQIPAGTSEPQPGEATVGEPIAIQIEVIGGSIAARDLATEQQWTLANANITAHIGAQSPGSIAANLAAEIAFDDQPEIGRLNVRLEQTASEEIQVSVVSDKLPLEPFQPWLARFLPGAWINGRISTDAQAVVHTDETGLSGLQTTGRLDASQVSLQAEAIAGDRLQFESLQVPWDVSLQGNEIQLNKLELQTDWAELTAQGSFNLAELASASLESLPRTPANVAGKVQLARLAAMLPNTLKLREGVWIDSGDLEFNASAAVKNQGLAWSAGAVIENVVGNDGQRAIRWEQPVEARVDFAETEGLPQLEKVSLVSPFAEATLTASTDRLDGAFQFDLQQLSEELSKFVDLESWHFQGRGEGQLALTPGPGSTFRATSDVKLTELNVAKDRNLIWAEPKLDVSMQATGTAIDLNPNEIKTAKLELRGARDRFHAELLQPVKLNEALGPVNLSVEATGPLASWAGRLRPWVAGIPEQVEGEAQLRAKLVSAPDYIQLVESAGRLTNLQIRQDAMSINEPRVEFAGDFRLETNSGNITSREATFQSSTITFRSADVVLQQAEGELPSARGNVAFRADLERLSAAAGLVRQGDSSWARGGAKGSIKLSSDGKKINAEIASEVEQLAILRAGGIGAAALQPQVAWSEPNLTAGANVVYDVGVDRLAIENLTVNGRTVRLDGDATVNQLSSSGEVQAAGALQYDSNALTQLLATYFGPDVKLQGDRQVRFQLAGRLAGPDGVSAHWSRLWNASAEAGWTDANVFGLAVGNGKLQGALKNGQLQIAPLDVAVGQGRLTARPVANLTPGAEKIELPRGPLISNVAISPEVSEAMLKYLAPIVAGATRTQGSFSLDLDTAQVPLLAPDKAHVVGKLDVHQLRVTPGPLLQSVVGLVEQMESLSSGQRLLQSATSRGETKLLSITDQQIQFMVSEGRVHHRDLKFLIDDVPVTSNGSVGFDQTIVMEIVVPIQQKWLGDKRAFQSLAGQTITIPVGGTFQNPRIDSRAVTDLSQRLLQGAAQQVIGDELNKAFDKLFK